MNNDLLKPLTEQEESNLSGGWSYSSYSSAYTTYSNGRAYASATYSKGSASASATYSKGSASASATYSNGSYTRSYSFSYDYRNYWS